MNPEPCCQTILLPRSKSMLARKLCIRFIAGERIEEMNDCDDIYYLSAALAQMCDNKNCMLEAGESATALRFLTAIAAARPGSYTVINGLPQLRRRPVAPLVDALRSMGASIEYMKKEGYAPLRISGRQLEGGTVDFTGTGSSQYASACLLISPLTTNGIEVIKRDKASIPYLEMTRKMLQTPNTAIEPDWSAASYFYEWTALCGQPILLPHLVPFGKSCQGDSRAMSLFRTLCNVTTTRKPSGLLIKRGGGAFVPPDTRTDMSGCPDLVPALAMTMAMKGIRGILTGIGALRIKETDRLTTLAEAITAMGGKVEVKQEGSDWQMIITGEPIRFPRNHHTITVNSHGDHRIAMCAMAALAEPHLRSLAIDFTDIDCVNKSFPAFTQRLFQLINYLNSL